MDFVAILLTLFTAIIARYVWRGMHPAALPSEAPEVSNPPAEMSDYDASKFLDSKAAKIEGDFVLG